MGKNSKSSAGCYAHGDRVFAKMKGYPHWPARIEMIPSELDSKDKYQVLFYGTYQTLVIKAEFLLPYNEETKQLHGKERKQKSFNIALDEIENDPNLENVDETKSDNDEEENSQEEDQDPEKEEDDEEEELDETESTETKSSKSNDSSIKSGKNSKRSQETKPEIEPSRRSSRYLKSKDKQIETIEETQEETQEETKQTEDDSKIKKSRRNSEQSVSSTRKEPSRRSVRGRLASNQSELSTISDDQLTKTNEKPQQEETSKTVTQEDANQPLRRLSSRPKQPNKRYNQEEKNEEEALKPVKSRKSSSSNVETEEAIKSKRNRTGSSSSTSNSAKSDSIKTNEKEEEETSSEAKIENKPVINAEIFKKNNDLYQDENSSSLDKDEREPSEKEIKKRKLKQKKLKEKKLAFILGVRIEIALDRMDKEIKKSLRVDRTDVNRCCLIMQDLIKLPFTKKHLFKSSNIVETVRKCRKFKDSELVRQRSNEFFTKLYQLFAANTDQFMQVFDKERSKFLSDISEKDMKKEKIWKDRCIIEDKHISAKKHKVIKHTKSLVEEHPEQEKSHQANCVDTEAQ